MKIQKVDKQSDSNKFQLAKQGTRISQCDIVDLRQVISYVMNLIGITSGNVPSLEQKALITDFLITEKPNVTCEEIRLAFRCEVAGTLGPITEHYQNFTVPYITGVLNKYQEYIQKKKLLLKKLDPVPNLTSEDIELIKGGYLESLIKDLEKCKENGECTFGKEKAHMYDFLNRKGIIETTTEEKISVFKVEVERCLKNGITEQEYEKRHEFKRFKENPNDKTNRFYTRCVNNSKAQLLREWVNSMILEDYDFNELNNK